VDALPKSIRESTILTGNNLGRLGNVEALPTAEMLQEISNTKAVQRLTSRMEAHQLAKTYLEEGKTEKALSLLLHAETL